MKINIGVCIIILFLFGNLNLPSQTDSVKELINKGITFSKEAYLQYNKDKFLEARSVFEEAFEMNKSDLLPLYYITLIDYKILETSLDSGGGSLFEKYYEPALKNAETLSYDKNFSAVGKILTAAIYMMKIAVSSISAVTLSPKIHSLLDEAQQIDPKNPYSYVVRGIMKYNTPGIFGGSYEDALKNFNYATKLFEDENNDSLIPVWGFIETLAWMGRTQEQLNNKDAAVFAYKKALNREPEFAWVKYSLLPKLQKNSVSE
jgi:tetratricopeptide (TPR) repeat protein